MIFNNFINKTNKYLKSVRILKTYVSFDMIFSDSWLVLKNTTEGIEVLENVGQDGIKGAKQTSQENSVHFVQ